MARIDAVRWYLGYDERTYSSPWEDFIERACSTHLSAFVIAVVVRSLWDSGQSKADDEPLVAVVKVADALAPASPNPGAAKDATPKADAVLDEVPPSAPPIAETAAVEGPTAVNFGHRWREWKAGAPASQKAQQAIEALLLAPWERLARQAGISEAPTLTHDTALCSRVARLFSALVAEPALSNEQMKLALAASSSSSTVHRPRV